MVLRKFYTPGNCVCRVVVYKARQGGSVDTDLETQLTEFFREERSGVFVTRDGDVAVALFRTPRGYYMFDPADRDRYGRAVAPPCIGKARACFSQYPNVRSLADKLRANIPPVVKEPKHEDASKIEIGTEEKEVKVELPQGEEAEPAKANPDDKEVMEPASFAIYGMDVSSLRRINQFER